VLVSADEGRVVVVRAVARVVVIDSRVCPSARDESVSAGLNIFLKDYDEDNYELNDQVVYI
jgi:hypothetical protein